MVEIVSESNKMTMQFRGPISALCITNGLLFSGSGPFLSIFTTTKQPTLVTTIQVFSHSLKICAIARCSDSKIIVIGERTFKVFNLQQSYNFDLLYDHSSKAIDKILSVKEDQDKYTILYAHNFVEHINGSEFERVFCQEEECLLYSGDLTKEGLVAAGTVFRSVLVWHAKNGQLLQRLLGHTGVIFDVCFLQKGADDKFLLASVSDDRSVRVWKDGQQIAEMYGHTARIWKVVEFKQTEDDLIIATASEDTTCRLWKIKQQKEVVCFNNHIGKNVRALDIQGDLIATGGEDTSIKLINYIQE